MMQGFSPFTRRLVALAILLFLVLGAVNLTAAVLGGARSSVGALEDARFRLARMTALQMRPPSPAGTPVPADLYFRAANHAAGAELAQAAVRQAAANVELPIESLSIAPANPAEPLRIAMPLAATGPEPTILAFVGELERARPAVRLGSWRISRTGAEPNSLRIEGTALAVWSDAR